MKIADGVEMMEIKMKLGGRESILHPTLIRDDNNLILVDTAFPGGLEKIQSEMSKIGASIDDLDKIIITHQDIDHIGSLYDLLEESNHKIEVLAHEDDKPYIQGEKRLNKMTPERRAQLQAQFESVPEEQRKAMQNLFQNPPKAEVDIALKDGMELPFCFGITVIHTPGHTPGHISLYLNQCRVLIAGDLLNIMEGNLVGPNPEHTPNMETALKSLKKLTSYDIQKVITFHGGLFTENPNQRIVELAK